MIVVEYMTALNMALKMSTEIAARERRTIEAQKDFICNLEAKSFYVDDPEISGQGAAGSGQLRACPFCGGEANVKMWCEPDTPYLVMCEACGASVKDYTTEAEAIEAWNRRAEPERKWIPVTEALPKEDIDVLLQFPHTMTVGYQEDGFWNIATCDDLYSGLDEEDEKPIAWQPLPEPYRGEK